MIAANLAFFVGNMKINEDTDNNEPYDSTKPDHNLRIEL